MTSVVMFNDNVLIEISGGPGRAQPITANQIDNVNRNFSDVVKAISNFVEPLATTVQSSLAKLEIESAEIDLGFSFSAEGNIVVCKASAEGSIHIKLSVKPKA
jgi:hypothetical protein